MNCEDLEKCLSLYFYDELSGEELVEANFHLEDCPACRERLEQTRRLNHLLSEHPPKEPTPEFLAECRVALEDAIDRELDSVSWKKLLREMWEGISVLPLTRTSGALALLIFGFGLGWALRPHTTSTTSSDGPDTSQQKASFINPDLGNMRINAITQVAQSPDTGQVRITIDAERRMTLEGSLDDERIRNVLVEAVKSYSNAGIRRDSLDALQGAGDHPSVRDALLYAIQEDPNPGVRLEALKTVRKMEWTPQVQEAIHHVLEPGNNPGLRVAALDLLISHADSSSLPILERLAANDPNPYVRMKSLSAVRRLGGNGF